MEIEGEHRAVIRNPGRLEEKDAEAEDAGKDHVSQKKTERVGGETSRKIRHRPGDRRVTIRPVRRRREVEEHRLEDGPMFQPVQERSRDKEKEATGDPADAAAIRV
jgi:hypothetical protein